MAAPSFHLPHVIATRDKILDGMTLHVGTAPEGEEFERFVGDLYSLLPEGIKYEIVYESATYVLGRQLDKKLLYELAWRLAGNLNTLKQGKIVYPWSGQVEPEWMPVQILSANRTKTWAGEFGYLYKMRVLAGSACPIIFWKTWTTKACSYIARKIGFSAPWKNHPYRDGHELVSMRFLVEVDPELCRDRLPGFEKVHCVGALLNWNRNILQARAHVNPPCPYDFSHFCYQCPVGYDQCMAGTHPKTYERKFCQFCNQETWHDPGAVDVCVTCRDKLKKR